MLSFPLVVIGILIVALAALVYNFHFLLYPLFPRLNPMRNARRVNLSGPTVFISDLHLKAGRPFQHSEAIGRVLKERHVSNLIVVGDLFDSPGDVHMLASRSAESTIAGILGVGDLSVNAYFVEGSPPHDFSLKGSADLNIAPLVALGQCAFLEFDRMNVIAYHGHDMSLKGAIGHGWDRFISKLSLERAWKRFAKVPDSDWVIFGHTHIPGIDAKRRVANCGGWQSIGFLVRPACTGLYLSPDSNSLEIVNFAR
jgi:UDP-2,3-diacylglucosamine pyrophosphatase LpxH